MKHIILTLVTLFISIGVYSQETKTYRISGRIIDRETKEGVPYATILINDSSRGAISDSTGTFVIERLAPSSYILSASSIGYKSYTTQPLLINTNNYSLIIEMNQDNYQVGDVEVSKPLLSKTIESPVSLNVLSKTEILKSPGSARDISRIISTLPGVGGSISGGYRNDLLVRGGGPAENRYYIDGVEVPNINHFSTQGSSGGPMSILDTDMIREVEFYSGAFPASTGNALSSVINFKLKDGDINQQRFKGTLSSTEATFAASGHIADKTTYAVSLRRSYLQFLFDALGLPILPTFTDLQFKVKHLFDPKNELVLIGLGAIDDMKLNLTTDPKDEQIAYSVNYLPLIKQNSYTIGAVYNHYDQQHIQSITVSNSFTNNRNDKFKNNDDSDPVNRTLKYKSNETEYHIKAENRSDFGRLKLNFGVGYDYTISDNDTYRKILSSTPREISYTTYLSYSRYSAYTSLRYESLNERLKGAVGIRVDGSDLTSYTSNPLNQLSPRISASYKIFNKFLINGSLGRYHQLPSNTTLAFENKVNLSNGAKYTSSCQAALGFEYNPFSHSRITIEGFYKNYSNSPISLSDNIPLSNKGVDYGVTGAELVSFDGKGRAYGVEFMYRLSGLKNIYGTVTYTYFKSEFKAAGDLTYTPSAWDNNHLLTIMAGYSLGRGWDVGMKFRVAGAAPYTPYDIVSSSLIESWDNTQRPLLDYSQYNRGRLSTFYQFDLRVDKVINFKSWSLGFYVDVQNVLNYKHNNTDLLVSTGVVDPNDPTRYVMKTIKSSVGTVLPSLGISIEF